MVRNPMKDKIVVLDTNVLLHDPEAPHRFGDLRVVIPMQVVEEIDRFKKITQKKAGMLGGFQDLWIPIEPAEAFADGVPIEGTNHGVCR